MDLEEAASNDRFRTEARRRRIIISAVSYLVVIAIAARGLAQYPELAIPLVLLLGAFLVSMALERFAVRHLTIGGSLYLSVHTILIILLYLSAPIADYWAIMALPSIIFAVRYYRRPIALIWVGVFSVTMSVMLFITHGTAYAPEYIILYLAAYVLVGSYALMLRQTEAAGREAESLLTQLTDANRRLKESAETIEELATANERTRLARELHDSVTQTIFSMTLLTRSAVILQEKDPDRVKEKLEQLQELANDALSEMRDLINQLRPASVEEDGLVPMIRRHIEDRRKRDGLLVELETSNESVPLSPTTQKELFRIVQEALNNVVKHAQVTTARLSLRCGDDAVVVTVVDDGVGFELKQEGPRGLHFGLQNMKERTEGLGGAFDLRSASGQGTILTVRIPIEKVGQADG